jgi:hypothetical protein
MYSVVAQRGPLAATKPMLSVISVLESFNTETTERLSELPVSSFQRRGH